MVVYEVVFEVSMSTKVHTWIPFVGEELHCVRECINIHDCIKYIVAGERYS